MGRGVFSGEQAIFLLAKTAAHAASIDEGFAFCLLGRGGGRRSRQGWPPHPGPEADEVVSL